MLFDALLLYQVYSYLVSSLAIVLNLIFLYLSRDRQVDTQGIKGFLANNGAAQLVQAVALLLIQPQTVAVGTTTVWLPRGPARDWSRTVSLVLCCAGMAAYVYATASYALFFVYKLTMLSSYQSMSPYFTRTTLGVLLALLAAVSVLEAGLVYVSQIEHEQLAVALNRSTLHSIGGGGGGGGSGSQDDFQSSSMVYTATPSVPRSTTTVPPSGSTTFSSVESHQYPAVATAAASRDYVPGALLGNDPSRNPLAYFAAAILVAAMSASYVIVLVSTARILNSLKRKQQQMSRQQRAATEIMVRAVFLAAMLPLLFATPVLTTAVLTYVYQNSLEWQEYTAGVCLQLPPLLTPLVCILLIRPYSRALKNAWAQLCCQETAASVMANQQQQDHSLENPAAGTMPPNMLRDSMDDIDSM